MLLFVNYTSIKKKDSEAQSHLPRAPLGECQSRPTLGLTTAPWSHSCCLPPAWVHTHVMYLLCARCWAVSMQGKLPALMFQNILECIF